jgi:hypothetical protein
MLRGGGHVRAQRLVAYGPHTLEESLPCLFKHLTTCPVQTSLLCCLLFAIRCYLLSSVCCFFIRYFAPGNKSGGQYRHHAEFCQVRRVQKPCPSLSDCACICVSSIALFYVSTLPFALPFINSTFSFCGVFSNNTRLLTCSTSPMQSGQHP